MENIEDLRIYTQRMSKGIEDKLFFLPFIEKDPLFIDYGCADGTLIKQICDMYPNSICFGYDNNEEMLSVAIEKLYGYENVNLCLTNVLRLLDAAKKYKDLYSLWYTDAITSRDEILNLSSVIHEVYSYCNKNEISDFWKYVFGYYDYGFERIAIRDMFFQSKNEFPRQFRSFEQFYNKFINGINKNGLNKQWRDFTDVNKEPITYKSMVHFLMKYKYVENWKREVNENYFFLDFNDLKQMIPEKYEIEFEESYILPYIWNYVFREFGIDLDCFTHAKLLLKKKEIKNG